MAQEIKRVSLALERARAGKNVSLISSGDSGVYGMAGVALELLDKSDSKKIDIEIIPGIMAACAAGSLLGAPLMHDFAVISLSDLLTKWKTIERRLKAAAKADFVIAIYNPRSKNRTSPLKKAWKIIAKYRSRNTPVGIVKNAYRENEVIKILSLEDASLNKNIDMTTTIIVGNSKTYLKNQYMITPRGYNFNK